ncbi:CvpA family protein [uncultured Algimonas sp.]|uniref:CvpA family protein n=1 Tax=uncultured Algimonas sp. TaxID=1547920 RepID=UPI002628D5BA|nr:CvpA family protein [uncultured Algimonas sp.]
MLSLLSAIDAAQLSIGPYSFNGFDTAVLVLLLISGLYAFARGFLREIVSILALVVSAALTLFVYGQFRFAVRGMISPPELADGVLILGTGLLSYIVIAMILSRLGRSVGGDSPGFIDRLLGGAFGVARGLLIAALFVMFWSADYRASQDAQEFNDYIADNPGAFPPDVVARMPESMREQLEADPDELPGLFVDSTFYPLLERIGDWVRALPFADMRSYAQRIKDGDLDGIAEEIRS